MDWTTAAKQTFCSSHVFMGASQEDSSADSDFQAMNFRTN